MGITPFSLVDKETRANRNYPTQITAAERSLVDKETRANRNFHLANAVDEVV